MNYNFVYWGPFLYHTKVDINVMKKINLLLNKKVRYNSQLAGHFEDEFQINEKKFVEIMKPYLDSYMEGCKMFYGQEKFYDYTCQSAWVNYMKPGDFNPPHIHDGDLSCVLYVKIPKKLIEENKNYTGRSLGPGAVEFSYGEHSFFTTTICERFPQQNEFYIFPANLKHCVFPYKSKCTRVSVSANFKVDKK